MKQTIIIGVIAVLVIIAVVLIFDIGRSSTPVVASFEECADAGYPIMESNPRQCRTPDGKTFTEVLAASPTPLPSLAVSPTVSPSTNPTPISDAKIRVTSPKPGATVTSPLVVTGEAVGPWFFEASFPVTLVDANGKIIAQVPAQAEGEWMVTTFVKFKATLTFTKPATRTGTLIFQNDNPSGDPERQEERRMPVVFY